MGLERLAAVFVASLLMTCVLTACNLGHSTMNQVNQQDTATTASDNGATRALAAPPNPTKSANAAPTAASTMKQTNEAKPTVGIAVTPKRSSGVNSNRVPTPTTPPNSTSRKQGDDLEQQLNQLLNNLDSTDTVTDAAK